MTPYTSDSVADHALDVLRFASACLANGQSVAFVIVTETVGGAVRSPGAIMAVNEDGESAGYVSGGCIDADVRLQAQAALADGTSRQVRYGLGSKFVDLKLPCGGAIDVLVWVDQNTDWIPIAVQELANRQSVSLTFYPGTQRVSINERASETGWHDDAFTVHATPKLKLRIAGRGADAITLTRLAHASGFDIAAQTPDMDFLTELETLGLTGVEHLSVPAHLPQVEDDLWTAFLLMFHDLDWEVALLRQALQSEAFYIGAVGSARTHAARVEALTAAGIAETDIARIHAPIGLIPAMRDASMLAVSALAEVVARFHDE